MGPGERGDLDLYVGVIPFAAFCVLLVRALTVRGFPASLRRLLVVTAVVGAALLVTVAALSTSSFGLGRVHERNLFAVAPLLFIAFLAWLHQDQPRPRRTAAVVAVVAGLLPLTIPTSAINHTSADSLALLWWSGVPFAQAFIALAALGLAAAFLLARPTGEPP